MKRPAARAAKKRTAGRAAQKRPLAEELPVVLRETHEGVAWTHAEAKVEIQKRCPVHVVMSARPRRGDGPLHFRLRCGECRSCTWRGLATYRASSRELSMKMATSEEHKKDSAKRLALRRCRVP